MSERTAFLQWFDDEWRPAEVALHNGDAEPRRALWSTKDPVTVFGAWKTAKTSAEADALFDLLADGFSDSTSSDVELISADAIGDLAYTIGYEHTSTSWNGEARTYTLRVTQLYRKENGVWKVFHRHGDELS
ncbi:MAG: nuclear transport factor 2 family protein [Kribbellaceae bacterium]|nr:nuclear transport factor 2 family protein [Kribbellaceae bacterium]